MALALILADLTKSERLEPQGGGVKDVKAAPAAGTPSHVHPKNPKNDVLQIASLSISCSQIR
jgi:hypothetical protein